MPEHLVLGIDGGGTKTAFELADEKGAVLASWQGPGSAYRQHGYRAVVATLLAGRDACLAAAGEPLQSLAAICVGLPSYGEAPRNDGELEPMIRAALAPARVHIVNDTEVAWAGSLACRPGINVVAGTGSIAFGCNEKGEKARCGGWSANFGDEGSGHWAGMKLMELFTKQADGRSPRAPLYALVRQQLGMGNDVEFIALMHEDVLPYRDKVAALQLILEKAALAGDEAAREVYLSAAQELALLVQAVSARLGFAGGFAVSYSGGMFRAGALIMPEFTARVQALGGRLATPAHSPVHGAVLMALARLGLPE